MALELIEGFELMGTVNTTSIQTEIARKYPNSTTASTHTLEAGRTGGHSLKIAGIGGTIRYDFANTTDIVFGCAVKITGGFSSESILMDVRDANNLHIAVRTNSDGTLDLYRLNNGTLVGTTTAALTLDQWAYIELHTKIDNSAGFAHLYVNENLEVTVTGVDTRQGLGSDVCNNLRCYRATPSTAGYGSYWDDTYLQTGSSLTPYGTTKVTGLLPDADGSESDWTPSTGSDNYAVVDENPYSDADYVSLASPSTGDRDLYSLEDASGLDTILGVQLNAMTSVSTGSANLKLSVLSDGTADASADQPITSANGIRTLHATFVNDPDTAAPWTQAGINLAEFGFEVGT